MWMIFFLLLPILGLAYCGWHLWTLIPLPRLWRAVLLCLGVGAFLLLFLNLSRFIDRLPLWLARLCYDVGNSSLFVMLYLVIIFLMLDLGRLVRLVPGTWLHHNFYTTVVLIVGLFAVFLLGNVNYRHKVREELQLTTTKPLSHPLRLVMLSDLHLGYHNPRHELARWIDLINAEKPDVVLIAGDIIDMSMRPLLEERMAEEFHRLEAPVYACLGNHEYFSGGPRAFQFYHDAGIHLLRDSCALVGHASERGIFPVRLQGADCHAGKRDLLIIGRDDRMNPQRKTLKDIMSKAGTAPTSHFTILLDHQPYHLEEAEQAGIDFQLSGHTHRGQVWPISWITDRVYECSFGPWQRGQTRYYISSGIGIWGGKFRIGTQSEYIVADINPQ
ncbi:MAG: metallophosphoesterase [Prevotella sp.]|nr:metallophosphoesterase [Prevotella sp.]MBR3480031.1 metallophosphoesterase [Prevotella sp.]